MGSWTVCTKRDDDDGDDDDYDDDNDEEEEEEKEEKVEKVEEVEEGAEAEAVVVAAVHDIDVTAKNTLLHEMKILTG